MRRFSAVFTILISLLLIACSAPATDAPEAPLLPSHTPSESALPPTDAPTTITPSEIIAPSEPPPTESPAVSLTPTLSIDQLEGFEVEEMRGFTSPDGQWVVHTIFAYPTEPSNESHHYLSYVAVERTDGSDKWVIEEKWEEHTLSTAWPVAYRWLNDSSALYYTHENHSDGCELPVVLGNDLYRADLTTQTVYQVIQGINGFALSPDAGSIAFLVQHSPLLNIRDLSTRGNQQFQLPPNTVGNLIWSPDQSSILFISGNYCDDPTQHAIHRLDIAANRVATLIDLTPDAFVIVEWATMDRALLRDANNVFWYMDVLTGDLTPRD